MEPSQASCVMAADRRGWGEGPRGQSSLALLHAEKLPFQQQLLGGLTAQCPGFLVFGDVHHWGLRNDALPVP